jgi:DNA gyrase/topoisomerase IV subunit B
VVVDAAILWTEAEATQIHGFVGMSPSDHGTHVDGLTDALVKAFGRIRRTAALRDHLARGLVAYLNGMFDDPRFGSPTRDWLVNPEGARGGRARRAPAAPHGPRGRAGAARRDRRPV